MNNAQLHKPVMLNETLDYLIQSPSGIYLDATLGLGGHSSVILQHLDHNGRLIAFEWDPRNAIIARRLFAENPKITIFNDNYLKMKEALEELQINTKLAGILFDFGVSSPHLDEGERGFSLIHEGPLDMRFNKQQSLTAERVVNYYSREKLIGVFKKYSAEDEPGKVARRIVEQRSQKKFESTLELAEFIVKVKTKKANRKNHPATQVFQALRIEVNNELENVKRGLKKALELLEKGGRIVAISFHSLEDKIVKNVFRSASKSCTCPPELLRCNCGGQSRYKVLTRKPLTPDIKETKDNPRSRSARLRVLEKITA
jgi:16S rRNA (cytosine1402-N4)-methyltransferase